MLQLSSYIVLALVGILVAWKYNNKPYVTAKNFLLAVAGYGLVGVWILTDRTVYLDPGFVKLVGVLFAWWTLCTLLAPSPRRALRRQVLFMISACFGLFLVQGASVRTGEILLTAAALINSVYFIGQKHWGWKLFKRVKGQAGFIGNTNWLGAYLMPHVFIALHLAGDSRAWLAAGAVILYALWLARSRAAFVGLVAGWVYLYYAGAGPGLPIWFIALWCGALLAFCLQRRMFAAGSLRQRWSGWKMALVQIKKTPLFGLGFDGMRVQVPYLQRDINNRNGGKLLKKNPGHTPVMQLVHNDYLQHVLDNGILGLIIICAVIFYVLAAGWRSPAPGVAVFVAALVGLLANGIFFHTFHITVTNFIFWYLIGALAPKAAPWTFELSGFALALYAAAGVLVYMTAVRWMVRDAAIFQFLQKAGKDFKALQPALRADPYGSLVNTYAVQYFHNVVQDPVEAYQYAVRAIEHYDGEVCLWELWTNRGNVSFFNGSFTLAKRCYEAALSFLPYYANAQVGLEHLKKVEKRLKTVDTT